MIEYNTEWIKQHHFLASFYGQSYLKIPSFPLNNNQTKIQLEFRTHQSDAFIFLAAGSSDYCLLYLERGQLAVSFCFCIRIFTATNDILLDR